MDSAVAEAVRCYLDNTSDRYEVGHPNYFARVALSEALHAYVDGNYGIGAVAVLVDDNEVREYRAHNAMITGQGIIDHAELRALLRYVAGTPPDVQFARSHTSFTQSLPLGLSMYGTLEPCPMCAIAMTNAGAAQSISTVADGSLVRKGKYLVSDGAANVIGEKARLQPLIWQDVQVLQGMQFQLLETADSELRALSEGIFLDTREQIDDVLALRQAGLSGPMRRTHPPKR